MAEDDHFTPLVGLPDYVPLGVGSSSLTDEGIVFEPLRDFLERDLPPAQSLVGVPRDGTNLLPRYGWVMPWGREGSGKTSILVDLLFHAAAGVAWLGYQIERALRIVVIVNEGIPGGLQDKLRQKADHFEEHRELVLDNISIYASPWGEFSFRNEQMVAHARDHVIDFRADYVALDPLHTVATTNTGAPDETEAFKHTLRHFGLWDYVGVITAHHSNKSGMVSGDWARHPDTVFHVEKDGKNPATKFTLQKARPADPGELGVPFLLEWVTDTLGYERVDLDAAPSSFDAEAAWSRLEEALQATDGPLNRREVAKAMGGNSDAARATFDQWLKEGKLVDLWAGRRTYKVVLPSCAPDAGTQLDTTELVAAQNGLVDRNESVQVTGTQLGTTANPPGEGSVVSCVPPLPKGGGTQMNTTQPGAPGRNGAFDEDLPF